MDYKKTLNLPQTSFSMRAGLAQKEPLLLTKWREQDLVGQIRRARAGAVRFILHDGPPYANGGLHHGHILNKILKDLVVKDRTMAGFDVPYVPGWDCHGLPIEVQVDKKLGGGRHALTRPQLHAAYRTWAQAFVDEQRDAWMRLGILAQWHEPYLTMQPAYAAATLAVFADLVEAGLVYRGLRPVHWCTMHQTALAEAEVEYAARKSPSAYVAFAARAPGDGAGAWGSQLPADLPAALDLVVWTTTPWTLPANAAIALHPKLAYVAVHFGGRWRLVAQPLLTRFLDAVGEPVENDSPGQQGGHLNPSPNIVGPWPGEALAGLTYVHVSLPRTGRVVLAEHVTTEVGTGCVHTAPGHGAEDFELGRQLALPIESIVDATGRLEGHAGTYAGLTVVEANRAILADLAASGQLLGRADALQDHRVAHCWRCQQPTITRATEQWWVAMDRPFAGGETLRQRSLSALPHIRWVPSWGRERMQGMLATRPDWCLSRQRTWGVPIAIVYCTACATPVVDAPAIRRIAARVAQDGAAVWYTAGVDELYGQGLCCAHCGGTLFRKEQDIFDVWFDSGSSFAAVLEARGLAHAHGPQADLYLEGSDQHRGWFHTSLLCAMAARRHAPYAQVLTHGFVVDGAGKKISKSKGNYVDPVAAIAKDGAEILRLWAASEDYRDDIRLSPEIMHRLTDSYRKVRNTIRFMLANLYDFDPATDLLPAAQLHDVDRYALAQGAQTLARARQAYADYAFHAVVQVLVELCGVELSAFYMDVIKDRLYADAKKSAHRRSAQTALFVMLRDLLRLLAPILSFTAEEAWSAMPRCQGDPASVHLALYPGVQLRGAEAAAAADPPAIAALRDALLLQQDATLQRLVHVKALRRLANAALEDARRSQGVGASVQASLCFAGPQSALAVFDAHTPKVWADLFIVSEVTLAVEPTPEQTADTTPARSATQKASADVDVASLTVHVRPAPGHRCSRCWLMRTEVTQHATHPQLCRRCWEAL